MEKRFLKEKEVMEYLSLSRTGVRNFCERIGATVHMGKSVRYDREKIDKSLSAQTQKAKTA